MQEWWLYIPLSYWLTAELLPSHHWLEYLMIQRHAKFGFLRLAIKKWLEKAKLPGLDFFWFYANYSFYWSRALLSIANNFFFIFFFMQAFIHFINNEMLSCATSWHYWGLLTLAVWDFLMLEWRLCIAIFRYFMYWNIYIGYSYLWSLLSTVYIDSIHQTTVDLAVHCINRPLYGFLTGWLSTRQ